MDSNESYFDFYADLRSDVLEIMDDVAYDEHIYTLTNGQIKDRLTRMADTYLHRVHVFGLYKVTRHHQCSRPNHARVQKGFPLTNDFGLNIRCPRKGGKFEWPKFNLMFDDYNVVSACPCNKENHSELREVSDRLIIDTEVTNSFSVGIFISILDNIAVAIDQCGTKKPRSSIREQLLLSVMEINDAILPFKIDDFVERYRSGSAGK
jgi:hypothetical protein